MIEVYTDGSCLSNPGGCGGWGFVVVYPDKYIIIDSGGDPSTTNNRMELKAVIEALKYMKEYKENEYIIYSDSQLTINCSIGKWKKKSNLDLWKEYDNITKNKKINFEWVKAHNGNKYNEMVDKIAYGEAIKLK